MSRRSLVLLLTLSALWGASLSLHQGRAGGRVLRLVDRLDPDHARGARPASRSRLKLGVLGSLRGRLGPIVVLALVQVAGPLTLIGLGEEHIASSLTGILVATAPIFTFLLAFALSGEQRDSGTALVGVAIGIVGVGMLLGVDAGGESGAIAGGLMVILAAFGYAVAAWYLKRNLSGVEPVATVAGTQAVAALVTLPLGLTHIPDARRPRRGRVAAHARRALHRHRVRDLPLAGGERRPLTRLARGLHRAGLLDLLRRRAARRELHRLDRGRARADPRRLLARGGRRAARTPPRCRGRG